jgi:hypothetical protein
MVMRLAGALGLALMLLSAFAQAGETGTWRQRGDARINTDAAAKPCGWVLDSDGKWREATCDELESIIKDGDLKSFPRTHRLVNEDDRWRQ